MAARVAGAAAVGILLALTITRITAASPDLMSGWYAYDYQAGLDVEPAVNVFRPAVPSGDERWVNYRQWSIDTPETPDSVLALVRYDQWDTSGGVVATVGSSGPDLRGRCVTFELRGDHLDLHGGWVTFWVMSTFEGQRWHTRLPAVTDEWGRVTVDIDRADWHNSWRYHPADPPALDAVLAQANSFGVGFVGFDQEPGGMLGMRGFEIGC